MKFVHRISNDKEKEWEEYAARLGGDPIRNGQYIDAK